MLIGSYSTCLPDDYRSKHFCSPPLSSPARTA